MKNVTKQTAMQELLQHFIDAWSSPGDCWNPDKVINKIESMIEKEKDQICNAYTEGLEGQYIASEYYYNVTYNK